MKCKPTFNDLNKKREKRIGSAHHVLVMILIARWMEIEKYFDIHTAQNVAVHSGNSFETIRGLFVMNAKRGLNEYAYSTKSANEIYIQLSGHCIGKVVE